MTPTSSFRHALRRRLAALVTPVCLICEQPHSQPEWLCPDCLSLCRRNDDRCQQCALPLPRANAHCGGCLSTPPPFTATFAPLRYEGPIRELIHCWKFQRQPWLTPYLVGLAGLPSYSLTLRPETVMPDMLVPVPTHWRRRWQRHFDHTWLLSQAFAHALPHPMAVRPVLKSRYQSIPQHQLSANQRRNRRQCFYAMNHAALVGRHIAVVDDVMTTGATASAAAAALLAAGASRVDIWVIARAPVPTAL